MADKYYYVKSGFGTSTTDTSLSKQTGAFNSGSLTAANCYASALSAFVNGGAAAGDFICGSDLHDFDSGSTTLAYVGPQMASASVPTMCLSVDDTNVDQLKAGATERTTAAVADLTFTGMTVWEGWDLVSDDLFFNENNASARFKSCNLDFTNGASDGIWLNKDNGKFIFEDCTVDLSSGATNKIFVQGGNHLEWYGGTVTHVTGGSLMNAGGANGGQRMTMKGTDLSTIDNYLVENFGAAAGADDTTDILIERCKLHASVTFVEETFVSPQHRCRVINSAATAAVAEYQYYEQTGLGIAQSDLSIYRNESTPFTDSGEKVCIKVTTRATVSPFNPFVFDLPARWMELGTAATDHVDIFFAILSATGTLNNAQVWSDIIYPQGTNKHDTYKTDNRLVDLFGGTPTTHTDDSGSSAWKNSSDVDLTTYNEYKMRLDTTQGATVTGLQSAPILRIFVGVPSVDIFFDTTVENSA